MVSGRRQGRSAREDVKRRDRFLCDGPGWRVAPQPPCCRQQGSRQRGNISLRSGATRAPHSPRAAVPKRLAKRAQKPTELASRPTARNLQRRMHYRPRKGHRLLPCKPATLKPFLCGLGATSLAVRNRLLHMPHAPRANRLETCADLASCRFGWAEAKRPAAWRTAGRRTPCRASTGGIAAMGGTGRPSNIRRGLPIP
jgi:hypothetical protein